MVLEANCGILSRKIAIWLFKEEAGKLLVGIIGSTDKELVKNWSFFNSEVNSDKKLSPRITDWFALASPSLTRFLLDCSTTSPCWENIPTVLIAAMDIDFLELSKILSVFELNTNLLELSITWLPT